MAFNMLESMGVFNDSPNTPEIIMMDIAQLHDSIENFYHVEDEQSEKIHLKNEELKASIEMYGIMEPLLVKSIGNDEYEIISGHRRRFVSKKIVAEGKDSYRKLPCIIDTGKLKEEYEDKYTEEAKKALMGLKLIQLNSTVREIDGWQQTEQVRRTKEKLQILKKNNVKMPGGMRKQLALLIGMSRSEVGRHEQIIKNLDEGFMESYQRGEIVEHAASELAAMPAEDQRVIYEQTGGKATVKDIKAYKERQAAEEDDDWEDDGDDRGTIINQHGIYKKEFIEAVNIEIPKSLGEIIIEIAYDPEDGLYHVGANYNFRNPYRGGGDSPSKNDAGYKTKAAAIKARLISIAKGEEKIGKALVKAGYLKKEEIENLSDWDKYGRTKVSEYTHYQQYKDFDKTIDITDERLPEGGFRLYLAQDKEDGLWRSSAATGFIEVGAGRWPHRDADNPMDSELYPAFETMEKALEYAADTMFWHCNDEQKEILNSFGYKEIPAKSIPKKSWEDMTPCEICRSANPSCTEDHCCKTCEESCNGRQECRIDHPPEERQREIDEWNQRAKEQRRKAEAGGTESEEPEAEPALLVVEGQAKPKERSQEEEPAEPGVLKIEAARYAMGVLEKEIEKCGIEIRYAEEQGKTGKGALAAAKLEYWGGVLSKVQADLFAMTGDDMFKE